MANLQSQIDILAKAVVKEHINIEKYKDENKGSVSLNEVSNEIDVYDNKGVAIEINGGGVLKNYKDESYQLEVNKNGKVSTTIFTYDNDKNFSGFWFYDNNKNKYIVDENGEIVSSDSSKFYLKSDTFVRRVNLDEGEIGDTQIEKNKKRMVYIENKDLIDGTLIYNKDTLIIKKSSDLDWIGNYYVEFDETEDKKIQLVVNLDLNNIIYPRESKYSVINYATRNGTGVNFDILYTDTDGNSSMVYIYRSKDIGENDFNGNTTLLAAHLSSGAITIYDYAFAYCSKLKKIKISDDVLNIGKEAFCECVKLKEITFPESMWTIGESAFENCVELTEIKIPCDIKAIKTNTFYNCSELTKVEFADIENAIVETIGVDAFAYCSKLKEITIPSSVKTIGDNAFEGCSELTQLEIPTSVETIGKEAFSGCEGIKLLEISNNTTAIGENAFFDCNNIETITVNIDYYNDKVIDDNQNYINDQIELALNMDNYTQTYKDDKTAIFVKKQSQSQ